MNHEEIDLWAAAFVACLTEGLKTPLMYAEGKIPQLMEGCAACADAAVGHLRKRTGKSEEAKP